MTIKIIEKSIFKKATRAVSGHMRTRAGKPYWAGHGAILTKPPRGAKPAPILEEEEFPEETQLAEKEVVQRYAGDPVRYDFGKSRKNRRRVK